MRTIQLLILGRPDDPHVSTVVRAFEHRGFDNYLCLDPAGARAGILDIHLSDTTVAAVLDIQGATIRSDDISVVWRRRPDSAQADEIGDLVQRGFVKNEANHSFEGWLSTLGATWVNDPDAGRRATNKVAHIRAAARVGLSIPETHVTNDPARVRSLVARNRTVHKTLGGPAGAYLECLTCIESQNQGRRRTLSFTTKLLTDQAPFDQVRVTPGIYQTFVEKSLDIRVTAFGARVVAVQIHSQERPETSIDFRTNGFSPRQEPHQLPPEIAERCIDLLAVLGLRLATIDFAFTAGRYVFLDLNPDGQFLFVDTPEHDRITRPFADYLIELAGTEAS